MTHNKILYTDGHQVVVTDSELKVRRSSYNLKGITKHGLLTLKPHRVYALLVLVAGLLLGLVGFFNLIPGDISSELGLEGSIPNANTILLWLGAGTMVIGILILGLMKERYAVHIETAEGEKNVIVSYQREYVSQIVKALNRAFNFRNYQTEANVATSRR